MRPLFARLPADLLGLWEFPPQDPPISLHRTLDGVAGLRHEISV